MLFKMVQWRTSVYKLRLTAYCKISNRVIKIRSQGFPTANLKAQI